MARIDVLPSIEIIRGFKKILDFYMWRGLPCVRAWPRYRPTRQTDASRTAALLFGAIIKAYSLTHGTVLDALRQEAIGIPRSPRDIYVTGVFGNLHEASMSDFLDLLTECRDFLSDLTALLNALDSIDTDELVVNVDESVLPPLAATTTNQATQITALEKIDDLQDALESAALDRLLVRGMDQLWSYAGLLAETSSGNIVGADGFWEAPAVTAGQIWIVRNVVAYDTNNPTTAHRYYTHTVPWTRQFHDQKQAFGVNDRSLYNGLVVLETGFRVRVYFIGALNNDWCDVTITGFRMTKET